MPVTIRKRGEMMDLTAIKIGLIIIAVVLYFIIIKTIRLRLKGSSRAARFKVGGTSRFDKLDKEGKEKKKVSLRSGSMWKRRF